MNLCLCDTCHSRLLLARSRRQQRLAALIVCSLLAIAIGCVIAFAK